MSPTRESHKEEQMISAHGINDKGIATSLDTRVRSSQ